MPRVKKTDTFEIRGMTFETPDKPKREDVPNHDKAKRQQKWERFDYTEERYESLTSKQKVVYMRQELTRMILGYWFYNNGVLTYITGIHYFYLQWWVMDDGNRPQYRDTDKRFFYFWRIIELTLWCLGMIYTKYRRQGASARGSAISVYYAITRTNILNGTISKTGQDSKDIFQLMIINGFKGLPSFLKPRTAGFDRSAKELLITKQAARLTKENQIVGEQDGLNNRINWLANALNAYDGRAVFFLFLDEGAKWKETSIARYWPIAQKTLTKGATRYGLAYLPSTINEMEKSGGKEFYSIWKKSNQESADFAKYGVTASRLLSFFLPAFDGFEGYIGEYGESIMDTPTPAQREYLESLKGTPYACPMPEIGARAYLELQRELLKDDEIALQDEIRQNPFTEEEAFRSAANANGFPQERLFRQKERIHSGDGPYIRRVTFYRRNDGKVDWIDDPYGKWQLLWDFKDKSLSNRYYWKHGHKAPANEAMFSAGGDPFSHTIVLGKGSMGVFYVYRNFDPLDQNNSDMFIVRYSARPKLKEIFFNDAAMTCEYFGCKVGFEEINDEFYEWFLREGMENYLVWTPPFMAQATGRKKLVPGIPGSGVKAIETHLRVQVEYTIQNWEKCWFEEQIDDWLDFDVSDRTIHDDTMASGYTLIVANGNKLGSRNVVEEPSMTPMIRTHVISG